MADFIIIGILIIVMIIGIYFSIKHFKGEGGCYGGGSFYLVEKFSHFRMADFLDIQRKSMVI